MNENAVSTETREDHSHPKDGPYGINATDKVANSRGPGVVLGGRLAAMSFDLRPAPGVVAPKARSLDISV
jgi:hypothetical protein